MPTGCGSRLSRKALCPSVTCRSVRRTPRPAQRPAVSQRTHYYINQSINAAWCVSLPVTFFLPFLFLFPLFRLCCICARSFIRTRPWEKWVSECCQKRISAIITRVSTVAKTGAINHFVFRIFWKDKKSSRIPFLVCTIQWGMEKEKKKEHEDE